MKRRNDKSILYLIIAGFFAVAIVIMAIILLLSVRKTKELGRDITTETSRLKTWQDYNNRIKNKGGGGSSDEHKHLMNMKTIENEAKAGKMDSSLVNIRRTPPATPGDSPKINLEFRNAQMAPLVKYLNKLESGPFIVQHLWIYLGRDGKSWDARATLVTKP